MNWPAGNWLTMGNPDTYFARLQGTVFNAPTGTALRLLFPPGSPNEEVTFTVEPSDSSNPTCRGEPVPISESFVIPPESAAVALEVELTEECSENLRESTVMRFDAEVVGDDVPGAPVFTAGDFIYENSGSCVVDNTPPEVLDIATIPRRDGTIQINVAARDEITQPIEAALAIRVDGQDEGLVDMRYDDPPVEGDTVFFRAEIGPFPARATVEIEPIVADDGGLIGSLPELQPGDLDNDGDVDRDDASIIIDSRNQIADPLDPRDIDGDGQITGLDARLLVFLCTRPRCAVN